MKKNGVKFAGFYGSVGDRVKQYLNSKGIKGAGDLVAMIAQPIAEVVDKVAKTNLKGCRGCTKQKDNWNEKFPI